MPAPVTVSVDVPQRRADVYAFLDVMANHESFTDHMLTDWRCSGPDSGLGARANVTAKAGGRSEPVEFEVVEAAKGKRVGTGTYVLSDTADGGTHIEFTYAFEQIPGRERPLVPLMRRILKRGNERAMTRLAERLNAVATPV
jgi:hypothetical protein